MSAVWPSPLLAGNLPWFPNTRSWVTLTFQFTADTTGCVEGGLQLHHCS